MLISKLNEKSTNLKQNIFIPLQLTVQVNEIFICLSVYKILSCKDGNFHMFASLQQNLISDLCRCGKKDALTCVHQVRTKSWTGTVGFSSY